MKVIAKPIVMVATFDRYGEIRPLKFRWEIQGKASLISIEKVLSKSFQKIAGAPMWIFDCKSVIDGVEIPYQLKYDVLKSLWFLYKI